jgi:hypothetical protein
LPQTVTVESQFPPAIEHPATQAYGKAIYWVPYAFTIFVSAFLLFQVQLIISKYILPWFGGTPAVWTTSMLFFQVLLLAGYSYSHWLSSRLSLRGQRTIQIIVLAASVLLLLYLRTRWGTPIFPDASWKPHGSSNPGWLVLKLLAASVGLPYFVLSTTGPLLQAWFSKTHRGVSPYRLYALSNLGSLLGLLSYPFVVEPALTLRHQATTWTWGYAVFALCCGICALSVGRCGPEAVEANNYQETEILSTGPVVPKPRVLLRLVWMTLAACASVMLIATTNQICQEVTVIPFLWVLPLSIYLLSFIICFEKEHWSSRRVFLPMVAVATLAASYNLVRSLEADILVQIGIYSFVLFACCMLCNGELVRLKPSPQHLTSFYLMISLGGAVGGVFVGLIAPRIFTGFWEYYLGLWLTALLLCAIVLRESDSVLCRFSPWSAFAYIVTLSVVTLYAVKPHSGHSLSARSIALYLALSSIVIVRLYWRRHAMRPWFARLTVVAAAAFFGGILLTAARTYQQNSISVSRNFYGVLSVLDRNSSEPENHAIYLRHGAVLHGFQFVSQDKKKLPTTYFTENSGVGLTLLNHPKRFEGGTSSGPLHIGVVGLGAGTIAAYGKPGDTIRFYEINPKVVEAAFGPQSHFSYLSDSPAKMEIVLGDARISMEHELEQSEPQRFDVLVVDAFSSDSIPMHLLTREAFHIYMEEMASPQAVLAIHISNRAFDLEPAVRRLAKEVGLTPVVIETGAEPPRIMHSKWMLLTSNQEFLNSPKIHEAISKNSERDGERLWTDDYSNLLQVLRR